MSDKIDFNKDIPMVEAIRQAYKEGQEDEALEPLVAVDSAGHPTGRFQDGDSVIFYDIRGEREIEITESLTDPQFDHFQTGKDIRLHFVTMIEYNSALDVKVAFKPDKEIRNTLAEMITKAGMKLLKITESEKVIHVGYFLNGKKEKKFPGEKMVVIPSPEGVANYALTPEMSAPEVADEICSSLDNPDFPVIVANMSNVDVVGHIEDQEAILKAVQAVDQALKKILEACEQKEITLIVTADHGTVEEWLYPDGAVNTGHTKNPVPFILADFSSENPSRWTLRKKGELTDVAPTVLELLGLQKPEEMTGFSLIENFPKSELSGRKILLLILDGWGMREEEQGNLIQKAQTETFDRIWAQFPHTQLEAAGESVGMPPGTVGNSESGHLHIGAGRRIFLDRVKIDKAIEDKSFFQNPSIIWAMEKAKESNNALHLLGIVSHYSSHGTIDHLFALLRMAKKLGVNKVFVHALLGRRGERPESGAIYVAKVSDMCRELGLGEVVTVIGRFWALDREFNWDRVEKTYRALIQGEGTPVPR
ncbi:MAG: alkaline phosphatase family protein [Candidatus Aminicenantes bacterium]|nr:MAG: alkaline phosphatase family protein [Candidatus Aminicenantes bacterium]